MLITLIALICFYCFFVPLFFRWAFPERFHYDFPLITKLSYYIKYQLFLKKHEKIIWNMILGCLPKQHQLILKYQLGKTERIARTAGPFCLFLHVQMDVI